MRQEGILATFASAAQDTTITHNNAWRQTPQISIAKTLTSCIAVMAISGALMYFFWRNSPYENRLGVLVGLSVPIAPVALCSRKKNPPPVNSAQSLWLCTLTVGRTFHFISCHPVFMKAYYNPEWSFNAHNSTGLPPKFWRRNDKESDMRELLPWRWINKTPADLHQEFV